MSEHPEFAFPDGAFELLFERAGPPTFDLPAELARIYGGSLGFRRPTLFANFVASVDGVVGLEGSGESGQLISGKSAADRFLMGLLRACAGAVVIGAGTLRASPKHLWTPSKIFPDAARPFAELRRRLGLAPEPRLVIATSTGELDPSLPALADATIATSETGAARLHGRLPATTRVIGFPADAAHATSHAPMTLAPILEHLHAEGVELVLTEGGPSLVGRLVAEDLLDELFLTLSPKLFGRYAGDARKALIDGVDLGAKPLELSSVRRHGSHLFLRYTRA